MSGFAGSAVYPQQATGVTRDGDVDRPRLTDPRDQVERRQPVEQELERSALATDGVLPLDGAWSVPARARQLGAGD